MCLICEYWNTSEMFQFVRESIYSNTRSYIKNKYFFKKSKSKKNVQKQQTVSNKTFSFFYFTSELK